MKDIIERFIETNLCLEQLEYFIRILLAGICGAVIGFERRKRFKDAGIRTHLILAIGCAMIMIVSKYAFSDILDYDAARIASNVVSGVGFLGAGVIFVKSGSVRGLTTAAGIWTTAAIGMAIGAGFYLLGISVSILLVLLQFFVANENVLQGFVQRVSHVELTCDVGGRNDDRKMFCFIFDVGRKIALVAPILIDLVLKLRRGVCFWKLIVLIHIHPPKIY